MHPLPAKRFFCILLGLFSLLIMSCGNTDISIAALYPRVVFAYELNQDEPEVFLSVYGEVHGDSWRLESMTITHKDTGLVWNADSLDMKTSHDGEIQFAGYPAFRPKDETFPAGNYTITWHEKSGRSFTSGFSLTTQSPSLPQKESSVFSVMIEDEDRRILYAGQLTDTFSSNESVLAKYPAAYLYRKYVLKNNTRVLYVYPPVYVREENE